MAVGISTAAVAVIARKIFPDLPWAAAIALGALLAPPDAVAALAVLRQVNPPHPIRKILEGESLLNDASSIIVFRFALAAIISGQFVFADAALDFVLVIVMGVIIGIARAADRKDRPWAEAHLDQAKPEFWTAG